MQNFNPVLINNTKESLYQLRGFLQISSYQITTQFESVFEKIKKNEEIHSLVDSYKNVQEEIYNNLKTNLDDSINESKKASKFCFKHFKAIGLGAVAVTLAVSSLPLSQKDANVPVLKQKAQYQSYFSSKESAFINLVHLSEGKTNKFILDNYGISWAYGWNPTRNTKSVNTQIAEYIGLDKQALKVIQSISIPDLTDKVRKNKKGEKVATKIQKKPNVQFIPKQLKSSYLNDEQIDNSAKFMMTHYEEEFLKVLKIKSKSRNIEYAQVKDFYNNMPSNQQAVMIHMTYKVGVPGLMKYDQFFDNLIGYMQEPTYKQFTSIAPNFEYVFKTRAGEKVHDQRVEKIHEVFFNDCATEKTQPTQSLQSKVLDNIKACRKLMSEIEKKDKKIKPT